MGDSSAHFANRDHTPTDYCKTLNMEEEREMADALSKCDENYQPISHSPLTLLELASMRIALNILLEKFRKDYLYTERRLIKITQLKVNTKMLTQVPYKTRKMVNFSIYPTARKLDQWVVYLKKVMSEFSFQDIYSRFDLVVFGGNGSVHIEHTVTNFIRDDTLGAVTRFEMACVHCLEEKIEILWPRVKNTLSRYLRDDRYFMLGYWFHRKGTESKLEQSDFKRNMIRKCLNRIMYLAAKYFFTSLNPQDQLEAVAEVFRSGVGDMHAAYLLLNCDASVQRRLLDDNGTEVLMSFIKNYQPIEYVVQCWLYVKRKVNENNLYKLIKDLIDPTSIGFISKEEVFKYKYIETVLAEIWYNSSPDQKSLAILYFSDISDELAARASGYESTMLFMNLNRDISFLLAMLSDVDTHSRNTFWTEKWPQWIRGVSPSQFEELLKLCLMNSEAIEDFKRTLPGTEVFLKYHELMIREGYYNELNEFVTGLYSNQEQIFKVKKFLLEDGQRIFLLCRRRDALARYIDSLFSNKIQAEEFKDQFIFSDQIFQLLVEKIEFPHVSEFSDYKLIVKLYLSLRKQDEFKNKLLNYFRDRVANGGKYSFYGIRWRKVLMWCFNQDEQRFDDFLESIPIHDIFEKRLSKGVAKPPTSLRDLRLFSMWYFKSKCEYEKFICEKVKYYEAMAESDIQRIFRVDKKSVIDGLNRRMEWYDEFGNRMSRDFDEFEMNNSELVKGF